MFLRLISDYMILFFIFETRYYVNREFDQICPNFSASKILKTFIPSETGINTYGIVARSSGVFGNRKKVCQCSGETIWEEATRVREETIRSSL